MSAPSIRRKKPRVTLVATAPDGTEIKFRTAAGYTWAGIAQRHDGTWELLAKGWSHRSVGVRARQRHSYSWQGGRHRSGWYCVQFRTPAKAGET